MWLAEFKASNACFQIQTRLPVAWNCMNWSIVWSVSCSLCYCRFSIGCILSDFIRCLLFKKYMHVWTVYCDRVETDTRLCILVQLVTSINHFLSPLAGGSGILDWIKLQSTQHHASCYALHVFLMATRVGWTAILFWNSHWHFNILSVQDFFVPAVVITSVCMYVYPWKYIAH